MMLNVTRRLPQAVPQAVPRLHRGWSDAAQSVSSTAPAPTDERSAFGYCAQLVRQVMDVELRFMCTRGSIARASANVACMAHGDVRPTMQAAPSRPLPPSPSLPLAHTPCAGSTTATTSSG